MAILRPQRTIPGARGVPKDRSFASGEHEVKCICRGDTYIGALISVLAYLANSPPCGPHTLPREVCCGEVEKRLKTGGASLRAGLKTPYLLQPLLCF